MAGMQYWGWLYNIIRDGILNKKKQKKTKCWLRAEGPESTDKMCDVYTERWVAGMEHCVILNKQEKKTLYWLRAEGPESTDKMCDIYRDEWLGCNTEADCII